MSQTPPELEHAARVVAKRVEKLVLEMLASNQVGEVAVLVSWGTLQPVKRINDQDAIVKVGRGRMSALKRAE